MAELAYVLMIMFEMQASHLFGFYENTRELLFNEMLKYYSEEESRAVLEEEEKSKGRQIKNHVYLLPDEDTFTPEDYALVEANKIKLNRVTDIPGWKATFEYDYGDGWEINLALEELEKQEVSLTAFPRVLEGEGFGIIEDVGGTRGLKELRTILKRGKGQKFNEICDWLGTTTLDMVSFDIEDMNLRLKKLLRVYREIYEYNYHPTKQSIDFLNRKYKGKGPRGY